MKLKKMLKTANTVKISKIIKEVTQEKESIEVEAEKEEAEAEI